jgi:hypothetical protein
MTGWWPLDETWGTTAEDLAGLPNNGTHVNGPTPTPGKVAGALHFDGVNDHVRVPNQAELNVGTGHFTLDAWVRVSTPAPSGLLVLVDKRSGPTPKGYSLFLYNGKLGFQMANGAGSSTCASTPTPGVACVNYGATTPNVADGQWHHVAAVVDRNDTTGGVRLYVDGVQVFSGAPLTGNLDNTSDLYLGVRTPAMGGGDFFPGRLDEVELFKRALTPAEIQAIFNAGSAGKCKCVQPPSAMTAWWSLDEPSGTTAQDRAGVANNGTHQNGPLPTPGMVAGALHFDGVDDHVRVPNHAELNVGTGHFTLDAWVRTQSSGLVVLVDKRSGPTPKGYSLYLVNGRLGFQMANGVALIGTWCAPSPSPNLPCVNYVAPPTSNVADGQWHHVAAVVDRNDTIGGVRLYVDGALVFTGAPIVAPLSDNVDNPSDLYLGVQTPAMGGGGFFPGDLDEVELFKRALTQAEIQAIFHAGAAGKCKTKCVQPPSNMTAWWRLDETSGTTAWDLAGVFNNGTHQNGPTPTLGMVAGALHFDGVDDHVRVPDHAELNAGTGHFTLDAWVRTQSSGLVVLVDKRSGPIPKGYSLYLFNGRLGFQMANGFPPTTTVCAPSPSPNFPCVNYVAPPTSNVADGQWHHVAAVVDRNDTTGGVRLYVDGALVFTGAPIVAPLPDNVDNPSDLYLGVQTPAMGGGGFFPGDLDEVELFKRALTQAEIQAIFHAGAAGKCKSCSVQTLSSGSASPVAEQGRQFMSAVTAHPILRVMRAWQQGQIDLPLFYRVRDEILAQTPKGQRYIELFYTHDLEILVLLLTDPALWDEGEATLLLWEPNLRALVDGQGDAVRITAEQVQAVQDFLDHLSAAGSPELRQVITDERARLGLLERFVGMTMAEAYDVVIGQKLYLPLMLKP